MEPVPRSQRTHDDYTVAIICPMSFEMGAMRYMLENEHPRLPSHPKDPNLYLLGDVYDHNVVLCCIPGQQGTGATAAIATTIWRSFPCIKWRLMVGIGGGVPSDKHDIRLGDVVVSTPEDDHGGVAQYTRFEDEEHGFKHQGLLWPPPIALSNAVERMRLDHLTTPNKINEFISIMVRKWPRLEVYQRPTEQDILHAEDDSSLVHRSPRDTDDLSIHYGLIASGNSVIKGSKRRNEIMKSLGDVLCFEMEAAGLLSKYPGIAISGISDYADAFKNDDWHYYAAATAAACARELLSYLDTSV